MSDYEEYFQDRKEEKKERKRISQKDRSKFKKTDFEKLQQSKEQEVQRKLESKELLRGRVTAILPDAIEVFYSGTIYCCTLKGSLKKERGKTKNLITVGDFVLFDSAKAIHYIEPRQSFLSKRSPTHENKEQLIASNIDQVLITTTIADPPLNLALIDRYIIATRKGNMEPVVVINKIDLLTPLEKKLLKSTLKIYHSLGICVVAVSALTGKGIKELKKIMTQKASVFAGESGVGKTSLINAITTLQMKVGAITEKIGRGRHTTTHARLVPLNFGGWCIDTPGIQKFGIWELKKEDLDDYFSEITLAAKECKFPNCSHTHEPACAIRQLVVEEKIPLPRFQAYLELLVQIISS